MSRSVSLTLSRFHRRLAKELMARGYKSRTGLIEELLRREHERVFGLPNRPDTRAKLSELLLREEHERRILAKAKK